MFPDQTTCQISKLSLDLIYTEFALNKIRTPCTFHSKFSTISKPYWFIPCFLYLCCTVHHTFYTSEHHFLPLHKYQRCTSERRSHGLSPHSCLEKKKDTKVTEIQEGCFGGQTSTLILVRKRGFDPLALRTLRKVQVLTMNSTSII